MPASAAISRVNSDRKTERVVQQKTSSPDSVVLARLRRVDQPLEHRGAALERPPEGRLLLRERLFDAPAASVNSG